MYLSDADWDAARLRTDPAADEVVACLVDELGPGEAQKFFNLLIRNIDIPLTQVPDYVKDFLSAQAALPDWADPVKITRAQQVFLDRGLSLMVILYFKSLPTCYLDRRTAEVLVMTGRLSGREWPETYARRVAETLQFVLDVMRQDGLRAGGSSVQTILKVRLMHASVRYFVQRHPDWCMDDWQAPISQAGLVMTLMTFGQVMVEGLAQMGQPLDETDAEAYFHAWRVAGHILGIEVALNPVDLAAGTILMHDLMARNAEASEAGKACAAALVAFSQDYLRGQHLDVLAAKLVERMMGTQYTALLGLQPRQGYWANLLPRTLIRLLRLSERIEDRWPSLGHASDAVGLALIRGLRSSYRSYKGRGLELPQEMQQAWKID